MKKTLTQNEGTATNITQNIETSLIDREKLNKGKKKFNEEQWTKTNN